MAQELAVYDDSHDFPEGVVLPPSPEARNRWDGMWERWQEDRARPVAERERQAQERHWEAQERHREDLRRMREERESQREERERERDERERARQERETQAQEDDKRRREEWQRQAEERLRVFAAQGREQRERLLAFEEHQREFYTSFLTDALQRVGSEYLRALEEHHLREGEERESARLKERQEQAKADKTRERALKGMWAAQEGMKDKIEDSARDLRILADVILSIRGRFQALEKVQEEDFAQGSGTPAADDTP
ncbi:hypothetical protein OG453_23670 [Streptomyces sp. NBC_01381]|uniref:hypothetical protein n=1 Tax=Streptomyces sp. NBC_01381 TaxID=2903845 RepID=UPI002258C8CC|nr:hypothetical protein [Streptomyces sp. NBC_01381]MCX4669646.1 hypothetical protein [Streptomyces sp. NBC_01381]